MDHTYSIWLTMYRFCVLNFTSGIASERSSRRLTPSMSLTHMYRYLSFQGFNLADSYSTCGIFVTCLPLGSFTSKSVRKHS